MAFKQTYKPDGSSTLGSLGTPSTVPFNNLASAQGTGVHPWDAHRPAHRRCQHE
ncbi:hypothetical protein [Pseudomonas indica]|uniref:hypothetical protein n=1 Tax=Pseudomonas indica TaxID=137658 RepID=UPI00146AF416|nr:hypothetical protein [Pseudomonas indica]